MKSRWFKCSYVVLVFCILPLTCLDVSADSEPNILISGTNGTVQPSQSLQIQVIWPGKTLEQGILKWDAIEADELVGYVIEGDNDIVNILVPDLEPGMFNIVAWVRATDGSTAVVGERLEVVDAQPYEHLLADPERLDLADLVPRSVRIHGVDATGELRNLSNSPRLNLLVADASGGTSPKVKR